MRLLHRIAEAYRQPLREATRLVHTPIHHDLVTCPFTGVVTDTTECVRCPRYVRTQLFDLGDGAWSQLTVACDPQRPGPFREPDRLSSN